MSDIILDCLVEGRDQRYKKVEHLKSLTPDLEMLYTESKRQGIKPTFTLFGKDSIARSKTVILKSKIIERDRIGLPQIRSQIGSLTLEIEMINIEVRKINFRNNSRGNKNT